MKILAHRGYWLTNSEKNSLVAFKRSFTLGFGTETDVRDWEGNLVISHDPANRSSMTLDAFLTIYLEFPEKPTLALNIKSDGLQEKLKSKLTMFGVENYFVFDMAVPDGLFYLRSGMNTYTRHSEYEPVPPFYAQACGVWIDEFNGHWVSEEIIEKHLSAAKSVCIVSPELHNRSYKKEWTHYRELEKKIGKNKLMLCTDFPEKAKEFFND